VLSLTSESKTRIQVGIKSAANSRLRFFAFHDYSPHLAAANKDIRTSLFLSTRRRITQNRADKNSKPFLSLSSTQKVFSFSFIFFLTVKTRKTIPSLAAMQRFVKTMSNH